MVGYILWLPHPQGMRPWYPLNRWSGLHSWSGCFVKENFLPVLETEPQFPIGPIHSLVTVEAKPPLHQMIVRENWRNLEESLFHGNLIYESCRKALGFNLRLHIEKLESTTYRWPPRTFIFLEIFNFQHKFLV